jgi:antibiotic biosynthesis monooxygenase (ABM) superfamily enzyme
MVLLGLYPTVMVLALTLTPHVNRLGLAVAMFISNVASCAILEWLVSPLIRLFIEPWLQARGKEGRARNLVGTALIVAALLAMVVVFYFLAG